MADITKCDGNFCELRDNCYRYTAPPNDEYQWWITAPPERPCPMYWPISWVVETDRTEEVSDGE